MFWKKIEPQNNVLRKYILYYWALVYDYSQSPGNEKVILTPEPNIDLVLSFENPAIWRSDEDVRILKGSYFSGIRKKSISIDSLGQVHYFAIKFLPFGLYPFINIPLNEFNKGVYDLEELKIPELANLAEKVWDKKGLENKALVLEEILLKLLSKNEINHSGIIDGAISIIHKSRNIVSVNDLCEELSIGYKRLEREFAKWIGVTPKYFLNMVRFRRLLFQIVTKGGNKDLANLIHSFGYFDQAHFIKDFKRFASMSPTEYFEKRNITIDIFQDV